MTFEDYIKNDSDVLQKDYFVIKGKNKMYLEKLKEMFSEMVVKKDALLIPMCYHPDFLLYTNNETINYDSFLDSHKKYYATSIQYEIQYDDEAFLEQGDKVAGRVWITTSRPNESAKRIEVILIVQYKDGKIYRAWELTYPDWSTLPAFSDEISR